MKILKLILPVLLGINVSHADTLYDQLKGNSKVTVGYGQGAGAWTQAQIENPLNKDVFFQAANTVLEEFKGSDPKNILFFGVTSAKMNLIATKHDFTLVIMYQGENFSDTYTCNKTYKIGFSEAAMSWERDSLAKTKLAVDCKNDFIQFAKTITLQ